MLQNQKKELNAVPLSNIIQEVNFMSIPQTYDYAMHMYEQGMIRPSQTYKSRGQTRKVGRELRDELEQIPYDLRRLICIQQTHTWFTAVMSTVAARTANCNRNNKERMNKHIACRVAES